MPDDQDDPAENDSDEVTDDAADAADAAPAIPGARGPHLPDALGRLPWLAWVFVLLAVGDLAWYVSNPRFLSGGSISDIVANILGITPSIVAILLPAALLARHPDAPTRLRTIFFGTVLFAAVQGLLILADPLQALFESLTPASEELPGLVPLAAAYNVLIGLVSAFGLTYIALGLSQARRFEDRSGAIVAAIVPVAAVLATLAGVISVSRLDLGDVPMSPTLALYLGSSVVLGILRVVVWAYLAAVATRGWRAGEEPGAGWWLAVLAAGLALIALALVNLSGLLDVQDAGFVSAYGYVTATAYALGHIALLAAFAVGLPLVDEGPADEDLWTDYAAGDAEDVPLDEDGWPIAQPADRAVAADENGPA